MDVLLIHPSQLNALRWGGAYPVRQAVASLWNYLRHSGLRAGYLDLELEVGRATYLDAASLEAFRAGVRRELSARSFDVAAISAWSSLNYLAAMEVARICRELKPSCRIVVGGYHAKAAPEDFLGPDSPVDHVVLGDGEAALARLCGGIAGGGESPRVIEGQPLDMAADPPMDWEAFPYGQLARGGSVFLNVSRGCPYECSFCLDARTRWRSYGVEEAAERVRRAHAALRPEVILFWEPIFGLQPSWRRAFLERLVAMDLDVLYVAMMRIDELEARDIELMAKLRFRAEFGFESGSATLLRRLQKTRDPARYLRRCRETLEAMGRRGVSNMLYVIYNSPGEDQAANAESQDFVRGLLGSACGTELSPRPFCDFPGSEDSRRRHQAEREFGTRFLCPRWWANASADLLTTATAIVPSASDWRDQSWMSRPASWVRLKEEFDAALRPDVVERAVKPYRLHRGEFGNDLIIDLTARAHASAGQV